MTPRLLDYEIKRLDEEVIGSPLLKKLIEKYRNFTTAVDSAYVISREFIDSNN